jgi:hypothetical protein
LGAQLSAAGIIPYNVGLEPLNMLTLHMPPNLESRLRDEAAKEGLEPGAFVVRAVEHALMHRAPVGGGARLSARESELLTKICIGLSDDLWSRYRFLRSRLGEDKLSSAERTELLSISNAIELANAVRMRHLVELADLRKIPLEQLMDQLGLGNGREVSGGLEGG